MKNYFYTVILAASILLAATISTSPSLSLSGSQFNAGNIIDDSLFYNGETMSPNEIQAFLNAKVPVCDTDGSMGPHYDRYGNRWDTRADFGRHHGSPPPYTCLKDFRQNTPRKPNEPGLCSAIEAKNNRSAAQMIDDVSRACNISQKVLLVLLQKEQGLVTDDWPWPIQYRSATGYGCPDSAPCDAEYYGFFNQVYNAALQFQRYRANPYNWNHVPFMTNQILYQANAPYCGARSVYIENYATAGLYNYTPYTPNHAALNNLYGLGDDCSAYGNRNFWRYYNDWFGSTRFFVSFTEMDSPRWLRVPSPMYKQDLYTGERVGFELWQDLDIKFTSKAYVNGTLYVRTAYDTERNNSYGIPFNKLAEIRPESTPPYYAKVTETTSKTDPLFESGNGNTIAGESIISLHQSMKVNNVDYYRMKTDSNNPRGWIISDALDVGPFIAFDRPRYMNTKESISKINIDNGSYGAPHQKNQQLFFDAKVYKDGVNYYRTSQDTNQFSSYAIPASHLEEVSFTPVNPKWLTVGSNTQKYFVDTSLIEGTRVNNGRILRITGQAIVNDRTFLQTEFDSTKSNLVGIPASSFSGVSYVRMDRPRTLVLKSPSAKINPFTLEGWSRVFDAGSKINFNQKTVINNRLYLRSSYDTTYDNASVIPYDILEEL